MVLGLIIANLVVILLFVVGAIIYRFYIISPDRLVKQMRDQGKDIAEIIETAKKKGINEKEVKLYYLLYYFQDFQNSGFGLNKIREAAISSGWPQDLVDIVYNKLRQV